MPRDSRFIFFLLWISPISPQPLLQQACNHRYCLYSGGVSFRPEGVVRVALHDPVLHRSSYGFFGPVRNTTAVRKLCFLIPQLQLSRSLLAATALSRLIHPFDRGYQYASYEYQQVIRDYENIPNMSRKGNCYDNASGRHI